MRSGMNTIWVLGDQLSRTTGALRDAVPGEHRVLMIESSAKLESLPYHRQRLHLVLASMRRFAAALRDEGFVVDYHRSPSLADGFAAHRAEFPDSQVAATEPNSRGARALMERLGVQLVRNDHFLCHPEEFARWAADRKRLRLEDFYRWQRQRLGYLMDGEEPAGGRWNYDDENREPPPRDGRDWPEPLFDDLDTVDEEVLAALPVSATGEPPMGLWATDRSGALQRLERFVTEALPAFGSHEDAMLADNWHLAHSMLSPYLNIGLLQPSEVCDAVEAAYRRGDVPINSAEGFIRQVIGWREFIWGLYWLWPDHLESNELNHNRALPPAFTGEAATDMRCLGGVLEDLRQRAWVHHIPRLMILSNFLNLVGVRPRDVVRWMTSQYIDSAEWVMIPNVIGMGLWADGGQMATKPYVSGGAYIDRMSDYCGDCRFDPRQRTGPDACPFSSLYWDFVARHRHVLQANHRMSRAVAGFDRLKDQGATRERAGEVIEQVRRGKI